MVTWSAIYRLLWVGCGVLALGLLFGVGLSTSSAFAGELSAVQPSVGGSGGTGASTHIPTCTSSPTPTRTPTPTTTTTYTPTATPTPCGPFGYVITQGTDTLVAGAVDTGNHCDDCTTNITLPFAFTLYDQAFTTANVDSNGTLAFSSNTSTFTNSCLPTASYNNVIFPLWDDLRTDTGLSGCSNYASDCGIFTALEGTAPNRIFTIEWRSVAFENNANIANFELRLFEDQRRFDVIYATVAGWGGPHGNDSGATVGVQSGTGFRLTQFECNQANSLAPNMLLTFTYWDCYPPTGTPTNTFTLTPTITGTRPTDTPTRTPSFTVTPTFTPTFGPCVQPVTEDFESGTLGLFTSSGTPGWSAVTTDQHGGLYSAYAPDVSAISDQRLTLNAPIAVPLNATQATLSFWHRYNLEIGPSFAFDGGVLEASTDGTVWTNASFLSGGYNYSILTCSSSNPLAGRLAWSGDSGGWQLVTVDLMPYRGQSVYFRFRLGTDETGSAPGWWIDDVTVSFAQSVCFTATPTGTPPTPTSTPAPPGVIVGHLTWQGISQPDAHNMGIMGTLSICVSGGMPHDYPVSTDGSGFFTVTTGLVDRTYPWWFKGPKWLATSGSLTISGGRSNPELGTQRAGDTNNSNNVDGQDFVLLKNSFDKQAGDPGYDPRADFNNDNICNLADFNLQKNNYGQGGAFVNCP